MFGHLNYCHDLHVSIASGILTLAGFAPDLVNLLACFQLGTTMTTRPDPLLDLMGVH
jgi:hypothetical protein